ncbi:MAG: hypothetical protein JW995_16190 [Melioribacteraceae bacterium]|nr:hypothetical protein [Melioribacteraceae bacterium]
MNKLIGIRREDKNIWERRVPLVPEHVKKLYEEYNIQTVLQPFARRAFSESEYKEVNAIFSEDLSDCPIILAVKEIPLNFVMPDKTYIFFSHTIKGQHYNMPLLKELIDKKCTLIDYECIKNSEGKRVVFFGHFAGVAGMIDALHGYGLRLKNLGIENHLAEIKPAYEYKDINEAREHIKAVSRKIKTDGLPDEKAPYIFGFMGYGNVSKGAQEIFDLLPFEEIDPSEISELKRLDKILFYKTVFKEEHLVRPIKPGDKFELQDYFDNPQKYESRFEEFLPYLSLVVNCIFWDENYPRFITKHYLNSNQHLRLDLICDITCDINGAVEITYKSTGSDNPAYTYDPSNGEFTDGFAGRGIVNIAVDNLPTELPRDSSIEFSNALYPFIEGIVNADMSLKFDDVNYPEEIKNAVIVYKGELTPAFNYLQKLLPD